MNKPILIKVQDGSFLNINTVTKFKISGRTILAECPGQTVPMKRFEDEAKAQRQLNVLVLQVSEMEGSSMDDPHYKSIFNMFTDEKPKVEEEKPVAEKKPVPPAPTDIKHVGKKRTTTKKKSTKGGKK